MLFGPLAGLEPQAGEGHIAQVADDGEGLGAGGEREASAGVILEPDPDEGERDGGREPEEGGHGEGEGWNTVKDPMCEWVRTRGVRGLLGVWWRW